MSMLLDNLLMSEAARLVEQNGVGISAEFLEGKALIVLRLTDDPYTELVLEPRKRP